MGIIKTNVQKERNASTLFGSLHKLSSGKTNEVGLVVIIDQLCETDQNLH
jgi:hypothetical protein